MLCMLFVCRGWVRKGELNFVTRKFNKILIFFNLGHLSDAYDELGNHYKIPLYCISLPTNLITADETSSPSEGSKDHIPEEASGEELTIKIRLSTSNKDVKMNVRTGETISSIKHRVFTDFGVAPSKQRCFFSGKLLYDKLTIGETKISKGFVVQIVVAQDDDWKKYMKY